MLEQLYLLRNSLWKNFEGSLGLQDCSLVQK